jgi:Xaa-Pro aminopeptidase
VAALYDNGAMNIAHPTSVAQAGGGVAVLPTAPERQRNGDSDHPFRHDSHFHYLTGFDEPEAWLLIEDNGRSTLLCREKSAEREIWDGHRLGPDAAPAVLGVDDAYGVALLDQLLPERLANRSAVWFPFGVHAELPVQMDRWLAAVRGRERSGITCPQAQRDLGPLLAEMRLVKDGTELATMRRAAQISAGAHARAMKFCAERHRADPQGAVREFEIEAELLHEFRRHGAQGPAYTSIVAAGANACVLHYATRRLRQRRDTHFPRQRPLQRGAARAVRHRAGRAGSCHRRNPPRRAPAGGA